jgi:general secretion pathway protein A
MATMSILETPPRDGDLQDYHGFASRPSSFFPDPRSLLQPAASRGPTTSFGIRERKGFIQLMGEVGAGKTTVCRAILEELDPYRTALILNLCLTATQLLHRC